jgi:hypothetical protein
MKTYRLIALAAAVLITAVLASLLISVSASAAIPAPCHMLLTVELTPDVPDPTDTGFLGSLLSNQVNYLLSVRREVSDTHLVLELTGLGPDPSCQNAIEAIRRDGRVLSVHVNKAPS